MAIQDVLPGAEPGGSNLTWSNSFRIAATSWDHDAQVLTLTPEGRDTEMQSIIAAVRTLQSGT